MENIVLPVFAMLGATAIIAGVIAASIRAGRRLRRRLDGAFGKPPADTDYELDGIGSYHLYKNARAPGRSVIDAVTWNDLDMDGVFKRLNACLTSVGEEYLYACLHEPQFEQAKLEEREAFIAYLKAHPKERLAVQVCLSKTGKQNGNGVPSFIFNAEEKMLRHPWIYKALAAVPLLCAAVMFINVPLGAAFLCASFVVNLVVYYAAKRTIDMELVSIRYISSMLWCCGKLCGMPRVSAEPALLRLKQELHVFRPIAGKMPGMDGIVVQELRVLTEYLKILLLYDIRHYNETLRLIANRADDFHSLYKLMGEVDLSICVLSFRESLPFFAIPRFHDASGIRFEQVFHPLLARPVTNSGFISKHSIVTGSNASGKSTFIKTLAVNGILAQTIYTCTAKEYALRFSLVLTSMALRDNMTAGESYFTAEINSMKRMFDRVQQVACTCFFDEILRGTNTVERIAASASALRCLGGHNCLCVAATHDIELTAILHDDYDNYHFSERITGDGVTFDYTLKHGPSRTRNAIKLLRLMGFDEAIISGAEALAAGFERTGAWRPQPGAKE